MGLAQAFCQEFEQEMAGLRRCLERVPDEHFAWKPHARSMSLGHLADHLATSPYWVLKVFEGEVWDLAASPMPTPSLDQRALLECFDGRMAQALAALGSASEEVLATDWTLRKGDKVFATLPRGAALRSFIFNHAIHHRGQLTVYLRLLEIPVPGLYGPSADEM